MVSAIWGQMLGNGTGLKRLAKGGRHWKYNATSIDWLALAYRTKSLSSKTSKRYLNHIFRWTNWFLERSMSCNTLPQQCLWSTVTDEYVDTLTETGQAETTTPATTTTTTKQLCRWRRGWLIDRCSTMAVAECCGRHVGGPIQQGWTLRPQLEFDATFI